MGNTSPEAKAPEEFHPKLLRKSSSTIYSSENTENQEKDIVSFELKDAGNEKLEEKLEGMSQNELDKFNSLNLDFFLNNVFGNFPKSHFEKMLNGVLHFRNLSYITINLKNNYIEGTRLELLCQALSNYRRRLRTLDLNLLNNSLDEEGAKYIGELLSKLTFLERLSLDISQNQICDNGAQRICQGVKSLTFLKQLSLDFSRTSISYQGFVFISEILPSFPKINNLSLKLNDNRMRHEGASHFAEKLICFKDLEAFVLELDKVDIDHSGKMGSSLIFANLAHLTKLEKFHFSYEENNLNEKGILRMADSLRCMKELRDLNLKFKKNHITANGFENILDALDISNMPFLAMLNLDFANNELNNESAGLQKISHLNELTRLTINLSSNELGNTGAENISEGLKKSEYISSLSLYLEKNHIDKLGAISLAQGLAKMHFLVNLKLSLYENIIDFVGFKEIISKGSRLPFLTSMGISCKWTNITQDEKERIAKEQKVLEKIIKARHRHMIIAFQIRRKLEKVFKRTMICSDVFETFLTL